MQWRESQVFEPEEILQCVWRRDYPSSWQVFEGPVFSGAVCLLRAIQVLLGILVFIFFFFPLIGVVFSALFDQQFDIELLYVMAVCVVIDAALIGLIVLLQRGVRSAQRKAKGKPGPIMVVTPAGVVAYRSKHIRAIAFAHIAEMRLRVRANTQTTTTYTTTTGADGTITSTPITTTTPAAPSIWLDLVMRDGQRSIWNIDIAPQDTIAQSILDAYTRYRA